MPKNSSHNNSQSVLWWVAWIGLAIGSFFVSSAFWTPLIAKHFGTVRETRNAVLWVATVFGTWMIILIPLIILMYAKVDKAYEDARLAREARALRFRNIRVEKSKRLLRPEFSQKLRSIPETISGGHLVSVTLADGRRISNVFVAGGSEIIGLYDFTEMPFEARDIIALEPVDLAAAAPVFLAASWLRLDGAESSPV